LTLVRISGMPGIVGLFLTCSRPRFDFYTRFYFYTRSRVPIGYVKVLEMRSRSRPVRDETDEFVTQVSSC
jgi:hypothetical protein